MTLHWPHKQLPHSYLPLEATRTSSRCQAQRCSTWSLCWPQESWQSVPVLLWGQLEGSTKAGTQNQSNLDYKIMTEHMVTEIKWVCIWAKYQDSCFFYNDALTQMPNNGTQEWMREKGCYNIMWALPIRGAMPEQSVQIVQLVTHLKWCYLTPVYSKMHAGVHCHATRTAAHDTNDPRRFSLGTLTEILAWSYKHGFDPTHIGPDAGIPCLKHIL